MSERTVLHEVHTDLGATFTDFAGWSMPLRYSSDIAEHQSVRGAAGIFDLSHMGEIEVTGEQATPALDGALVSDISAIKVGRAKYTMICAEDGGIIDDLVVYRRAEDRYLVVANAANVGAVVQCLDERVPAAMARVVNATSDWSLIAVQGPRSGAIVSEVAGCDVNALRYYAIEAATVAGHDILLARTGYTGEDGFELYCRPEAAVPVWHRLTAAGAPHGLRPAGLASRDSLRLEAGMPLYGQELTREHNPFEAGLGRVVAFGKPLDFVGRAALRAQADRARTRRLVGLAGVARRSPRTGYDVALPATREVIGAVTSGIPSPTLGHAIAFAYVPVDYGRIGTELAVDIRGEAEPFTVIDVPFYRRPAGNEDSP